MYNYMYMQFERRLSYRRERSDSCHNWLGGRDSRCGLEGGRDREKETESERERSNLKQDR